MIRAHNGDVARSEDPAPALRQASAQNPEPVTEPGGATDPAPPTIPQARTPASKLKPTRISGTWVAVIVAVIVLIFLLIFILQNTVPVTVNYLGLSGTLSLGVALLFAAVGGALLVAMVGVARIVQLRRFARRNR